jgi:hypothetical protein
MHESFLDAFLERIIRGGNFPKLIKPTPRQRYPDALS